MVYRLSLSPADTCIESVGHWARAVAQTEHPDLASDAEQATRALVSAAIRRTKRNELIHTQIDVTPDSLRIEVHDPGGFDDTGGFETAELSSAAISFGASGDHSGHRTWVILRKRSEARHDPPAMTTGARQAGS
ncbi:hypothetical protein [Nonomuraea guangzhouensis]|uniref:ATP-binding protein n=1 Tax=Nonomuraea guangzhouensis TaxID=1291555 RepID=A0ABW4GDH9_9ACTN|nr:hypothetical protein [Nonomuraea guangzhouensis]